MSSRVHIHISFLHALITLIEVLLAWIPIKIVAATFEDRSALAGAVLHVL